MEGKEMIPLFSYGTLRSEKVQMETFGRLLDVKEATLPRYKLGDVEIKDDEVLRRSEEVIHPIAVYTGDQLDEVEGSLLRVTSEELALSDSYEVDEYQRILERLKSGELAWVYVERYTRPNNI
jgi:gamma-glutamylcyclotransferase (GGCT)/AIG2-like uncharacterized protein YtfP